MNTQLPIVALVGAPNAGKSTLLNKIEGKHRAITSEIAGTTRDRQYAEVSWNHTDFLLVDTAGLEAPESSVLQANVQKQIDIALAEADVIVFVVDSKAPKNNVTPEILSKIRKVKKPLILAINKTDSTRNIELNKGEFSSLGIKESYAVSAVTGNGIGDLMDAMVEHIEALGLEASKEEPPVGIAVSIIGKPNVGKSSLFNAIINEDRVVVSPIPGTTRTPIDTQVNIGGQDFTFIDTAGLKRKAYTQEQPDVFAGFHTFKSIRRSDVALLLIDATEKITKQDQKLVEEILEMDKGLILVLNKIDLYKGSTEALHAYVAKHFAQAWISPIFFVSAEKRTNIDQVLSAVLPIYEARNKTIPQDELDAFLARKMKTSPPKRLLDQKVPRVFELTQIATNPPLFELLVNFPAAIAPHFRKTIENGIIRELNFWGTPINLKLKGKDKK